MMQFTKVKLTLLTLFLLGSGLLTVSSAEAQTVHALLIIMDDDPSIGQAMKVDQEKVERLLTSVNRVFPVRKTVYLSSRKATRRGAILRWIRNVQPDRDDVILVYYGGHGAMVSNTYRKTYLELTDGKLFRSELADTIQQANPCRLKLLITDACSNAPRPPIIMSFAVETVSKNYIKDLFGSHEGFLHVNGATEGEYGWCHTELGSFFTISLMAVISDISDTNRDGFVEWKEVFELAKKDTQTIFEQAYPYFSSSRKSDLRARGITSQTPKAYSLPKRIRSRPPMERGDSADSLWELRNPRARYNVELQTDKSTYRIDDYLTLRMEAQESCYIMVLNWDKNGKLTVLLPNQYESDNFVRGGQTYTFPTPESDYDYILPGPIGRERFKLIAVRKRSVSQALKTAMEKDIPREDSSPFRSQAKIVPRDTAETKILKELLKLDPADWAEASTTIILRSR